MIRMMKATPPTVPAITFRLVAASLALLSEEERVVGICVKIWETCTRERKAKGDEKKYRENRIRTVEVVPLTTTVEMADVIVVPNAPVAEVGGGVSLCKGVCDTEVRSAIKVEVGREEVCEDSDDDWDVVSDDVVDVGVVVVVVVVEVSVVDGGEVVVSEVGDVVVVVVVGCVVVGLVVGGSVLQKRMIGREVTT